MEIRRPSIIFAISSILGILLAYNKILIIDKIIILSMIFIVTIFLYINKYLKLKIIFIAIALALIFGCRFIDKKNYYDNINKIIDNSNSKNVKIDGYISGKGKSTNSNYYDINNVRLKGRNLGKIRCYYGDGIDSNKKIGEKVEAEGKIFLFEKSSNIGEFDSENYYRSIGLSASMYINNIDTLDDSYNIFLQGVQDVKGIIQNNINLIFAGDNAGIFNCMITGDKSGININKKKMYQENGIAHILAISGLHLSILGLGIFEILRKKFRLNTSALIVSIFILLYGIFIDCSISSLRAIIMLYVRFLSLAIGRSYDSKNTLYILIVIFLMINPYNLFNVGFDFSYMAILSLNSEYKINDKIKIPSIIILTLCMLPITVYNYFTYPLYSLILNLIVIPLMTLVLLFGIIGLIFSFVNIIAGRFFVGIVNVILLIYEKLCILIEKLPNYKIIWGKPSFLSIIIFYTILILIYFGMRELYISNKEKGEESKLLNLISFDILKKYIFPITSAALIIISILNLSHINKYNMMISCLSVGQGDSFVLENNNKTYIIDGGSSSNNKCGEYIIEPHLLARRIDNIDKIYISHSDSDHTNGIKYLIKDSEDIHINEIILPIAAKNNNSYDDLISNSIEKGINVRYMKRGDVDTLNDDLYLYCISPSEKSDKKILDNVNAHSLCMQLKYNNKSMLFTGDMTKDTEIELIQNKNMRDNLKSDILKVAHHGSKTSSIEDFVDKVNPKVAIISYGYKNSYGHPHDKTLNTLNNRNIKIYNTVDSGEIDIIMDKNIVYNEYFSGK